MANELRIVITADDHTDRTFNAVERKIKTSFRDRLRGSFGKVGTSSGAAFLAGFLKAVTFGQVGRGFAYAAIKMQPQMAKIGGGMGAVLAAGLIAELSTALTAALPLVLGAGMLALPIVGIMKQMIDANKDLEKIQTKLVTSSSQMERATERVKDAEERVKEAKKGSRKEAERNLEKAKEQLEEVKKEHKILEESRKELEKRAKPLNDLKGHWKGFLGEIQKPVRPFLFKAMEIIGSRLDEWAPKAKKAMDILAPALLPFTSGVLTGIENFFKAIGKEMPSIKSGMEAWGDNFGKIGTAFGEMVAEIMKDPEATIQAVEDFVDTLSDLARTAGDVIGYVGDLAAKWQDWNRKFTAIRDEHNEIISGFKTPALYEEERDGSLFEDIKNDFKFYIDSLDGLNTKIEKALEKLRGKIVSWAKDTWKETKDGFKKGIDDTVDDVKDWYHKIVDWFQKLYDKLVGKSIVPDLIDEIVRLFKTLPGLVAAEVEKMKDRAVQKVKDMANRFIDFVASIPGRAKRALSSLGSRVSEEVEQAKTRVLAKAKEMKDRFIDRMQELVRRAREEAGKVKGAITGKFAGARDWLRNKGGDVIRGFRDGLTAAFDKVKEWVGGIATWIKDHKGPVSLDRQLLVPAGKALMGGLLEGLKFGFGPVGDFVYGAATSVKDIIAKIKESQLGDWAGKIGSLAGGASNKLLNAIMNTFGIGGGTYPGHGERGASKAWDFMATGRMGDMIASFAKTFAKQLGVMYVIWNKRIWSVARNSEGWRPYTRYGSSGTPSQMHTNHVHVSLYGKGTDYARRGWAVVGENGPELLKMRGGERVIPAGYARAGSRSGIGDGGNTYNIYATHYSDAQALKTALVEMNRRGELAVVKR